MAFFLKPSVGTWLVRVHGASSARPDTAAVASPWQRSVHQKHVGLDERVAERATDCSHVKKSAAVAEGELPLSSAQNGRQQRPNHLLPSVGTWLMKRPLPTPKQAQSWSPRPWVADFSSAAAVTPLVSAEEAVAPAWKKKAVEQAQVITSKKSDGSPKKTPAADEAGAKETSPVRHADAEQEVTPIISDVVRSPMGALQSTSSGVDFQALGSGPLDFRVTVPPPYPGVQYRKSMNLEDRWPRYAQTDSVVTGTIKEKDGLQWLRVEANVFLPTKVGNIVILQPAGDTPSGQDRNRGGPRQQSSGVGKTPSAASSVVPLASRPAMTSNPPNERTGPSAAASAPRNPAPVAQPWWACCSIFSSSAATDSEVIIRDSSGRANKPQGRSPASGGAADDGGQQRR